MTPFDVHAAIYAPLDAVAACLLDPARLRAWQPSVLDAARRDAATLAVRRAVRGRARAETWSITRPAHDVVVVARPCGPGRLVIRYALSRPDPRTHVMARFTLELPALARPLAPWLARAVRRDEADHLERLARLLAGDDVALLHAAPDPRGD